jgi:hypothetical protein
MEIPNESRRHGDMPIPALACTRIDVWAKITVVLAPTAASLAIILSERLATTRCVEKRWRTGCFSPPGSQPAGGAKCRILFFPASERKRERGFLEAPQGSSVLTVGDADDFPAQGGIVQFRLIDTRIHIGIVGEAGERANLRTTSKPLSLADPARH